MFGGIATGFISFNEGIEIRRTVFARAVCENEDHIRIFFERREHIVP